MTTSNVKTWFFSGDYDFKTVTFERTDKMSSVDATYTANYRKPEWELYKECSQEEPNIWTLSAYDDNPEAGICLNFKAGLRDIEVTITLTQLLLMAKAIVDQQGHELFVGVDTSERAYGKR